MNQVMPLTRLSIIILPFFPQNQHCLGVLCPPSIVDEVWPSCTCPVVLGGRVVLVILPVLLVLLLVFLFLLIHILLLLFHLLLLF